MMQLRSVDSATETSVGGVMELSITADLGDGNGTVSGIPYGWDQTVRDPHGLYPQVDAWMAAHPDFAIGAYVPPTPSTNPLDYILTKRQVCSALIMAGVTDDPDGFVLGVLATIPDVQAKALAINDWKYAPSYHRDNALFNDPSLLGAAGITTQQIDQFWLLGAQQPA